MNPIKSKSVSRSIKDTSLYYSFLGDEILSSEDESALVTPTTKLNVAAVARYLVSDNLVSQSPFSTIFSDVLRIPPGTETTLDGFRVTHRPADSIICKSDEKVLREHFLFPDQNASLLFSGGLDSATFLAVNPDVKHLYHINYHGEGSRLSHVAREVAEYFGKNLIEVNANINDFSMIDYCDALSEGITGIQSPSQYCFSLSLNRSLSDPKTEYLVSGQNCDTMLYVDHHHAPTQLILHERFMPTIRGLMKRHRVWRGTSESDLEETKFALSEHMGAPSEIQKCVIKDFTEQFKDQYNELSLPDMPRLAALKLIRWFRGSATINDNFELLRKQTGVKRIAGLHHTKFLPSAIQLVPSSMNLIFCKTEIARLFHDVAGIRHRKLVTHGILKNIRHLSISRDNRAEALNQTRRFDDEIVRELFDRRRDSVVDLLDEVGCPIFIEFLKTVEKKSSVFTPDTLSLVHRLINLDLYVRRVRA